MPTKLRVAGMVIVALTAGACGSNGTGGDNRDGAAVTTYDFAGSYAGVLTQGTAACEYGTQAGSSGNAVLVLTQPSPTEVDLVSIDWCTIKGTPSGGRVGIEAYVCPTVTYPGGDYSVTTLSGGQLFLWSDGTTLEVNLRFSTQTFSQYLAGQNICSYSWGGYFKKQ